MEASAQLALPFDGLTAEREPHLLSEDLRHLLEDECFMLLILEHLVDYGLQECRLVCRRWRNICKQFPVKIKGITNEQFFKAETAFPNAVSVSMDSFNYTDAESELSGHLLQLTRLKSFSFGENNIRSVRSRKLNMRSPSNLSNMNLTSHAPDWIDHMIASLSHLTNLTKLVLFLPPGRPQSATPFAELEKISELDVSTRLFGDDEGRCMFPSLTNLTHLGLTDDEVNEEAPVLSFEVCFVVL